MSSRNVGGARALLAAVLVLTGCTSSDRDSRDAPNATPTVGIVGDSITFVAADAIRDVLMVNGLSEVTIDAVPGRRVSVGNGTTEPLSGLQAMRDLLAAGTDPDVWVVALGSNDVFTSAPDRYGVVIDEMLALIPEHATVVWIDLYLPGAPADAAAFNAELARRDRITVGSWWAVAGVPDAGLVMDDQVHPSEAGKAAFAGVIAYALGALGLLDQT